MIRSISPSLSRLLAHLRARANFARLLFGVLLLVSSGGIAAAADPPPEQPTAQNEIIEYPDFALPVAVEVADDVSSPDGRWVQKVRLTITEGGTFGDASLAVYGNVNHYDEMFAAARSIDPSLAGPTLVRIGQEIALEVDPTRVFALKQVRRDATGLTRQFAGGVKETSFERPTSSVVRLVEFPLAPVAATFHFPTDGTRIDVPSGGRIVDLRYRSGDDLATIVRAAIGETSYLAAEDIARQTGWAPTRWPPPVGEAKRVVLGPVASYRQSQPAALTQAPENATARAAAERLAADRARVGIVELGVLADGTVFRVAVGDPQATAREVARLLFGDEREYLNIATRAGFTVPTPPLDYNPILFGTTCDVTVPFAREWFPYAHETDPKTGADLTRLLNGTVVARYPAEAERAHGIWESTSFPNGYRSFTYRPNGIVSSISSAVAYVRGVSDLGLEKADQEAARRRYAGEFVWDWSFGLPREPGDIPDQLELQRVGEDSVLLAVIGPSAPLTPIEAFLDTAWNRSPLAKAGVLLGAGVVVVLGVGLSARRRK